MTSRLRAPDPAPLREPMDRMGHSSISSLESGRGTRAEVGNHSSNWASCYCLRFAVSKSPPSPPLTVCWRGAPPWPTAPGPRPRRGRRGSRPCSRNLPALKVLGGKPW